MRFLATVAALLIIGTAERYAGSYNLALDILELIACLAGVIWLWLFMRNTVARRGLSFSFIRGSPLPYLFGVTSYLLLAWIIFSATDYFVYSSPIPIERTNVSRKTDYAIALSGGGYRAAIFMQAFSQSLKI
jgi:hypothetical protein